MKSTDSRTELLLIRHAESEWNASGRWQGQADPVLSPVGRRQAEVLAADLRERLAGQPIAVLVSSDLQRAFETARAVSSVLELEVRPDPRLRELDVGAWSGRTRGEIEASDASLLARFEAGDPDVRPGGGETRREIRFRAHAAVEDLAGGFGTGLVVVVSHLGFLRALLPGVEPGNAEWLRVYADEALARRQRREWAQPSDGAGGRL